VQQTGKIHDQNGGLKLLYGLRVFSPCAGTNPLCRRNDMASNGLKRVIGLFVAGSLMMSSTAAMASNTAPVQQVDPWAVLSAMSAGAPATAMCGAAAAAAATAQPTGCVLPVVDAVPAAPPPAPPPPLPVAAAGGGISPLMLGLIALAAGVGVILALHNHSHGNSPA
jgi:hypothetical protein